MATPGDLPQSVIDRANPEVIPPPPDNPADNDPRPVAGANQVLAASRTDPFSEYLKKHPSERLQPPELVHPPQLQKLDMPPKQEWQNPMMSLAGPLIFFTLFGGLMSKKSGMNAMTAATGLMKGHMEGQQANFDANYNNWKSNVQTTLANNKIVTDHYKNVLEDQNLTTGHKLAALYGAATGYGDPVGTALLNKGDIGGYGKWIKDREEQQARAEAGFTLADEMITKRQKAQADVDLAKARADQAKSAAGKYGPQLTDEAVEMRAKQAGSGDPRAFTGVPWNSPDRARIINKMAELGMTGEQIAAADQNFRVQETVRKVEEAAPARADASALKQITEMMEASTAYTDFVVKNGKNIIALAKTVDHTGIPALQRWINAGRINIEGDPDVTDLNFSMNSLKTEAARLVTQPRLVGQLTDSARHDVSNGIPEAPDVDQIQRIVDRVKIDGDIRQKTLSDRRIAIQNRLKGGGSETGGGETGGGGPVRVSTPEEAEKLAPGTRYVTPEGKEFTR